MFKELFKNIYTLIVLSSIGIFIFSYLLVSNIFYTLDKDFQFFLKTIFSDNIGVNKNIVLVEIDEKTLSKHKFPFDRALYKPVLDNLKKSEAAVIGFDILFLNEGTTKSSDLLFSKAIKDAGNVILGSAINSNGKYLAPYKLFRKNIAGEGYYTPFVDPISDKVYSVEPFKTFKGNKVYEGFSFAMIREYYNNLYNKNDISIDTNIVKGAYNFIGKNIPVKEVILGGKESFLFDINYIEEGSRADSINRNYEKISFLDLYEGNYKGDLKDKIVLIGFTAAGTTDEFVLPGLGSTKGVYIHLNAINSLLNKTYIIHFNRYIELLIVFIFTLLLVYGITTYINKSSFKFLIVGAFSVFIVVVLLYLGLYKFGISNGLYIVPSYPMEFLLVLFSSFFIAALLKYITEDKNKAKLSKALGEYVSKDIADEILSGEGSVNLEGERKKITIFFSDIAGFTTISEKLSPEELVGFLREYLGDMSNIIMDERGFINKYEGDAIMALWGCFGHENSSIYDACIASLKQQEQLEKLNQKWEKEGGERLGVRMGLHTGEAIVGNIGAVGRKMEFTALGDSVNLGSRLEGVNKFYDTNICVSEDVYKEVKDRFVFRFLDKIKVKGKNLPVKIFELIGRKGEVSEFKLKIIEDFEEALNYYFDKDLKEAEKLFHKIASVGDKPSEVFEKRCKSLTIKFETEVPREGWDGVWEMTEK